MADPRPDWSDRLRRVFAAPPSATVPPPAAAADLAELARDLAEERAAIMEYDADVPRARAEALAFGQHGLPLPAPR